MNSMFRGLVANPLVRAQILAGLRHGLTLAGGLLIAWLNSKGLSITGDDATMLSGDIAGAGMIIAGQLFAQADVAQVHAKIVAAIAAPPTTPAAAIDALKSKP